MTGASEMAGAAMAREMREQPATLRRLLVRRAQIAATVASLTRPPLRGVLLIARGTSDNAAVFGRYVLEAACGVPVTLAAPSLWIRYGCRTRLDGHLAVALSQSGGTPEIVQLLRLASAAGARTLGITNDAKSPLAVAADAVLALDAGLEQAVPATKTFTAQLLALVALADAIGDTPWSMGDLARIPDAQQSVLDDPLPHAFVDELCRARAVVSVGSGFLYAIALESALKLVETTSLPALPYSAADFLHGPVAVAGPDVPVICYAATGRVLGDVARAAEAAADRGAAITWVSDAPGPPHATWLPVPRAGGEELSPLVHAARAQQLAHDVSRALGRDPDHPAGLQKVTAT